MAKGPVKVTFIVEIHGRGEGGEEEVPIDRATWDKIPLEERDEYLCGIADEIAAEHVTVSWDIEDPDDAADVED